MIIENELVCTLKNYQVEGSVKAVDWYGTECILEMNLFTLDKDVI